MGRYVFSNLPRIISRFRHAQGFQTLERDRRTDGGAHHADLTLALAGATTSVEVVGHAAELLERDPTAHTDLDQSQIAKLPMNPPRD
jgi:hypothetical protein